jgi:hypothetical protein
MAETTTAWPNNYSWSTRYPTIILGPPYYWRATALTSTVPYCTCVLLAQPQALELVPARNGKAIGSEHSNGKTIPQAVFDLSRPLHLPSQPLQDFQRCVSCQHRHSHEHRFLYLPSSPTRTRPRRVSSPVASSNPFTAVVMTELDGVHGTVCSEQQYQQSLQSYDSRSPSISCLTHGEIIGLVVSI